jgi:hypothetical protein
MSKPIFVVRIPMDSVHNTEQLYEISKQLQEVLHDYHMLPLLDSRAESIQFECFNAVNTTDVELEELKSLVLKQLGDN